MNSHASTPEPGQEPVAPGGGSGPDAHNPPGSAPAADTPAAPPQDRPQYGLRAADLGLPSPYEQYQREQEAAARAAQQNSWQTPAQQQPGPYATPQGGPGWQAPQHPAQWFQGTPPEKPEEPRTIRWAFWLILSGCAFGLIASLQTFLAVDFDEIYREMMDQMPASTRNILSQESPDSLKTIFVVSTVLTFVITVALYVLVAVFVKKGHQWARVLGTVLAAISVTGFGSSVILDLLSILCGIVGMILCWLPDSSAFFARMKLHRDYQKFARFRASR